MSAESEVETNGTPVLVRFQTDPLSTSVSEVENGDVAAVEIVAVAAPKVGDELKDDDLLLAATLVQDAVHGQDIGFKTDPASVRAYRLYNHRAMRWGLYFAILLNLCLGLFEKPATWPLPIWATISVEGLVHAFYIFRFFHGKHFAKPGFWKDTKHVVVLVTIILTCLDMIIYIFWINLAPYAHPVRWSRALRPLYMINFAEGRQIRRAFRNIRRTLPGILNVLVLFFCSVLLFALMGLKIFQKRKLKNLDGSPYFEDYWESIWALYVLVTTANDPDIMMPAYDNDNWSALFFVVYLLINLYIFMSILLAVIYNNYKKHLKNEVRMAVISKRKKLFQAFEILKVQKDGKEVLTEERWSLLMKAISNKRSGAQIELLLHVLDEDGDNCLLRTEFLNLVDLLNVPLTEVHDRKTLFEKMCPSLYLSRVSEVVKMCVKHRFFRYFFDFMIVVNAVFIGLSLDDAEWFFLVLFAMEILLKMYAYGFRQFFSLFWNWFDFLVIFSALIATIIEALLQEWQDESNTLDILLVLRVLRLIKIIGSIDRFKVIVMTILNIGPSIITYGGVIFVFYYIFAIIGMEVFSGLVAYYPYDTKNQSQLFCGNPALNGSEFARERYCSNNFSNILRSFVLLFELTVVNQWHVLTSGFVLVTSKAARIYFFTFHLICVVIILNIFTAFVLEAFILEYSLSKGKFEHRIEQKIKEMGYSIGQKTEPGPLKMSVKHDKTGLVDNIEEHPTEEETSTSTQEQDGGLSRSSSNTSLPDLALEKGMRFHLKKRSRKKVEVLLQYMFENELGPEGLLDIDDVTNLPEEDVKPFPLTLDNVT
ncbi:two pore calcium channel protein 1 [Lingula anatina]|uniref:Two pore calcium channel protein 1 n=1 Tax=Lingula anatina TaxID=7574 RepID=A0A1S3ILS1_LINAN|nr:two pore calcium channel protein 1 [Lingula anatina]|eukprot:XP_013398841.1 two pore calcium channel protein 1 [Lingula anatina]